MNSQFKWLLQHRKKMSCQSRTQNQDVVKRERKVSESRSVMWDTMQHHGLYWNSSPWHSPGQKTGVGSLFPSPRYLPNPGIKPRCATLQED